MKSIVFLIFIIISLSVISSKNLRNVFKGSKSHPTFSNLKYVVVDRRKNFPTNRGFPFSDLRYTGGNGKFTAVSYGPYGSKKPMAPPKYPVGKKYSQA